MIAAGLHEERSPIRGRGATVSSGRGALVRGFAAGLDRRYAITTACTCDAAHDYWEISWTPNRAGQPTEKTVLSLLRHDPDLGSHAAAVTVHAIRQEACQP